MFLNYRHRKHLLVNFRETTWQVGDVDGRRSLPPTFQQPYRVILHFFLRLSEPRLCVAYDQPIRFGDVTSSSF